MKINNLPHLKSIRKRLRNFGSPIEAILWNHLKNSQTGEKFRRQHSAGPYILDFYCPRKKLAIELDGATHDNEKTQEHDANRTNYLNGLGIRIVRFQNKDILKNLDGVLVEIKKTIEP